ncbi:apolipoprotein L1-like [Lampris incognitus]|uniref:apolipoprotein L1-like n=1 Tax=Lampris incognitus TaxID=2546036 RepID=UPI0024B59AE2|nr:apolipoprotein L1-like [Lampris incognitus]
MGKATSILAQHGYTTQATADDGVVAKSKEGELRMIKICEVSSSKCEEVKAEIQTLIGINHPNIVKYRETFQDGDHHYIVMDHCQGGNLAERIKKRGSTQKFQEDEILNWIVQICMALKCLHEGSLHHENLMPERILLKEFETVCLGDLVKFVRRTDIKSRPSERAICYSSPETLACGIYDAKSDIWSVGCVLYELCMLESAFTAENTVRLIPKIVNGPYPSLPGDFSPELCQLLNDIFQKEPFLRPTATEILGRPFIITFLSRKLKSTIEKLPSSLVELGTLADGLEKLHQGTTIGSLTGGVIGAAGGITSIVGLILSPFTLGASLVVTGVGIGVAVTGGATAGISNITNMVNQSSDRQAIRSIVQEFDERMSFVVTCLQVINEGLEMLKQHGDCPESEEGNNDSLKRSKLFANVGKGLGGIGELVRLIQVVRLGKIAAQTAKVLRVAEVATGVLATLFLAIDVFFIAMDAKEIHHIREAQAENVTHEGSTSRLQLMEEEFDDEGASHTDTKTERIKSETMKFVYKIRQTVQHLQGVVNELNEVVALIP